MYFCLQGLETIFSELVTLDVLVYDMCLENLTVSQLEKLSPLEKAQLLMSQVMKNSYLCIDKQFLVPG